MSISVLMETSKTIERQLITHVSGGLFNVKFSFEYNNSFSVDCMEFTHYVQVRNNITDKIRAERGVRFEEDDEE